MAVASIVNVIGDLALSPRWGIQGAGVATALATVASCFVLVDKVRKTTADWKAKEEAANLLSATDSESYDTTSKLIESEFVENTSVLASKNGNDTFAVAMGVQDDDDIPFWSLPDKSSMIDLFKLAGPIFFTMVAKILCYSVMTVRATNFGIVPLASHNIMMRVFFFFACFGDSLSQAAQSFYPQVAKKSRVKLLKRLFVLSTAVGICNFQFSRLILQQLGKFLTKDPSMLSMMAQHATYVGYAVLLHPFIMLLEG